MSHLKLDMNKHKVYHLDYYRRKGDTFPCCFDNMTGNFTDIEAVSQAFIKMNARGFECVVISFKEVDENNEGCYPSTLFYTLTKSRN